MLLFKYDLTPTVLMHYDLKWGAVSPRRVCGRWYRFQGRTKTPKNYQEDWPTRPRSRETRQNVVYNRYVGIFAMGAIGPELIFEGNAKSEKTLIRKQLRAITRHTLAVHNNSGNTQLLGVKYDTWQLCNLRSRVSHRCRLEISSNFNK